MTTNEKVQELLSEGLTEARKMGLHAQEDGYCAAYLAQKMANGEKSGYTLTPQTNPNFQQWVKDNPETVLDVFHDIENDKIAELLFNPTELGQFIVSQLRESYKDYKAMEDNELDAEPEHDMRDRVNGYRLDFLGV